MLMALQPMALPRSPPPPSRWPPARKARRAHRARAAASTAGPDRGLERLRAARPDPANLAALAGASRPYVADQYPGPRPPSAGLRRLSVCVGPSLNVSAIATARPGQASDAPLRRGLGALQAGWRGGGLDAFNQAQPLFARHGMHVRSMQHVMRVTPVGTVAASPCSAWWSSSTTRALPARTRRPRYRQLAPLRDDGLERYDFFLGTVPQTEPRHEAPQPRPQHPLHGLLQRHHHGGRLCQLAPAAGRPTARLARRAAHHGALVASSATPCSRCAWRAPQSACRSLARKARARRGRGLVWPPDRTDGWLQPVLAGAFLLGFIWYAYSFALPRRPAQPTPRAGPAPARLRAAGCKARPSPRRTCSSSPWS